MGIKDDDIQWQFFKTELVYQKPLKLALSLEPAIMNTQEL